MTDTDDVKKEIDEAIAAISAVHPDAAEYLRKHIVYDHERGTVVFTGDPAMIQITPSVKP